MNKNKNKHKTLPLHTYEDGQNPEYCQNWILARLGRRGNRHPLLLGMQNGAATLEASLSVPDKMKHTLSIQ